MPDTLAGHEFFHGFPAEGLSALDVVVEDLATDTEVIHAGAPATDMRFLLSGRIALSFGGVLPQPPFETLGKGDVLGVSWVRPEPVWAFSARTMLPTRCLRVSAASLNEAMSASQDLRLHVTERLNEVLLERLHAVRLQHLDLYRNPHARN